MRTLLFAFSLTCGLPTAAVAEALDCNLPGSMTEVRMYINKDIFSENIIDGMEDLVDQALNSAPKREPRTIEKFCANGFIEDIETDPQWQQLNSAWKSHRMSIAGLLSENRLTEDNFAIGTVLFASAVGNTQTDLARLVIDAIDYSERGRGKQSDLQLNSDDRIVTIHGLPMLVLPDGTMLAVHEVSLQEDCLASEFALLEDSGLGAYTYRILEAAGAADRCFIRLIELSRKK